MAETPRVWQGGRVPDEPDSDPGKVAEDLDQIAERLRDLNDRLKQRKPVSESDPANQGVPGAQRPAGRDSDE